MHDITHAFTQPGAFLAAVQHAAESNYRDVDARLRQFAAAGADEHRGDFGEHGGFLVPTGAVFPRTLRVGINDPIAQRTTQIPMDEPTVAVPARVDKDHSTSVSSGLTVSRRAQTSAITSSRMELEQVTLAASTLMGLTFSTGELADTSPRALMALLEVGFSDEMNSTRLNERLNGTGSGEPLGNLTADCLIAVQKETGQAATTLIGENITAMALRCWNYAGAVWLANPDTREQLITSKFEDVQLYQFSRTEGQPDTLAGRPIFYSEFMQALGSEGDLLCGVWSEYLDGTYQLFQSAESIHVRYETHEKAFKFWVRGDGRPWWKTVLTPRNGGATLSPFITLEART